MHPFGRRRPDPLEDGVQMPVDRDVEEAIAAVEAAVGAYLESDVPPTRTGLLEALDQLDGLLALGDEYAARTVGSVGGGLDGLGGPAALGARGPSPIVDDVLRRVLQAQITLVRCAKDDLRNGGTTPSIELRSAVEQLAAIRRTAPRSTPPAP